MDPKTQLDPKLKEAYERVMNANFSAQAAAPIQSPQPAKSNQQTPPPPTPSSASSVKPPGIQPPAYGSLLQGLPDSTKGKTQDIPNGTNPKKPKSPILIALGVIVFFALYTFIWIKVFNVSLPFLSLGTNNPKSGANQTQTTPRSVVPAQTKTSTGAVPTTAPPILPTNTVQPTAIPTPVPTQGAGTTSAH